MMAASSLKKCVSGIGLVLALCLVSQSAYALTKKQEAAAFIKADKNRDKLLSKSEFRGFMDELARLGLPVAKRVKFWRVYGMAFSRSDFNGDGILTPKELLRANKKFRNAGK